MNFKFPISNFQNKYPTSPCGLRRTSKNQSCQLQTTNCKLNFRTAFIIVLFFIFSVSGTPFGNVQTVKADELSDLNNQLNELNQQINQINSELAVKRQEKKTLQNEIAIFDAQIYQIQLQINRTEAEIAKLEAEINDTLAKIKEAEENLAKQKEILNENLRILYEEGQTSSMELVAGSDNLSEYMNKTEYLKSIQDKVSETIDKIKALKEELDLKKKELETKKTEQITLKNQQEGQRQGLASQRAAKDNLLLITKGQEANYNSLLQAAFRAKAEIDAQISRGTGNTVESGPVNKGDTIGIQGSTGFSTGDHLHFTVFNGSVAENPRLTLGGIFRWPLSSYQVMQEFGGNWQLPDGSWAYASGHNGIDLAGSINSPVLAAGSGILYRGWNPGGYGNYAVIDHGNGYKTLYGHMK